MMIDEVYASLSFGSNLCAFTFVLMNYLISITGSKVKSASCVKIRKSLKKTSLLVPLCTNDFVLFFMGTTFFPHWCSKTLHDALCFELVEKVDKIQHKHFISEQRRGQDLTWSFSCVFSKKIHTRRLHFTFFTRKVNKDIFIEGT